MKHLADQEGFISEDVDDLMREFKPDSFEKLPSTVAILDSELTRWAKLAEQKPAKE